MRDTTTTTTTRAASLAQHTLCAQRRNDTFLLPLERYSTRLFSELYEFPGFGHCRANVVLHSNGNHGYGDDARHHRSIVDCSEPTRRDDAQHHTTTPGATVASSAAPAPRGATRNTLNATREPRRQAAARSTTSN